MYKAIIADDEPIACRNLSAIIHKYFNEFEVIKTFTNGKDALDFINEENSDIDILFSDIRMPKLNGINLIQEIHKKYPKIILIIISGYSDFSYARSAMQNGVSDYLLKPLVPSIVRKLMIHIKKDLDELYFDMQTQFLQSLYLKDVENNVDYMKYFTKRNYYIAAFRKNTLPQRYNHNNRKKGKRHPNNPYGHPGQDDKEQLLVVPVDFISDSDFLRYLKKIVSINNEDNFITMVYYPEPIDVSDFKSLIKPLFKFLYDSITLDKTQIRKISKESLYIKPNENNQLFIQIMNSINNDNLEETKQELHNLFEFWSKEVPPQLYLENILRKIMYAILSKNNNKINTDNEYLLDDVFFYSFNLKELENNFLNVFVNQVITNNAINKIDTPEFVKMITNHIDSNYRNQLNMNTICNKFGLSQPYLSKIFRKYLNDTFTHYLTKVRMDKAKEFMTLNTNSNIKNIAELVGYQDQFYFSRVFTNYFGISPSTFYKELNKELQ